MTGLSNQQAQTGGKRLQLLRDLVPGVSRVMLLTTVVAQTTGALQEAQALGLTIPDSVLAQATETIK